MAEQPWQVDVGDWASIRELQGWRLRVEVIVEGLRITARPLTGSPRYGSPPDTPPAMAEGGR
jgi:hypothetical protein